MAAYRIDWRIELRANRLARAQRLFNRLTKAMPVTVQLRRMEPSNEGRGLWDVWFITSLPNSTFAEAVVASMHISETVANGWGYRILPSDEERLIGDCATQSWLSGLRWASFELVCADAPEVPPPLIRDNTIPEQMAYTIWIEAEAFEFHQPEDPTDADSDVIVHFANHQKWQAWFITFARLDALRRQYQQNGECLAGRYFWASEMIVIDEITREAIEAVIRDLMDSGEFEKAFTWAGECDEMEGTDQAYSDND